MTNGNSGKLEYKVFARIGKQKYDELLSMLKDSQCRTISELLRNILQHQKITVETHDGTLDKVIVELSGIRKELHAIGININQVVRHFHSEGSEEGKHFRVLELTKLYQQTDQRVSQLFILVTKISELWYAKSSVEKV